MDLEELAEGVECSICGAQLEDGARERLVASLAEVDDSQCTDEDIQNTLGNAMCEACHDEDEGIEEEDDDGA